MERLIFRQACRKFSIIVAMRYGLRQAAQRVRSSDLFVPNRLMVVRVVFCVAAFVLIARFFQLQVLDRKAYQLLASTQHGVKAALIPTRGTIYVQDRWDGALHPVAKDRDAWNVYAVPKEMKEPVKTAEEVAAFLDLPKDDLIQKFSVTTTSYLSLKKDVPYDKVQQLREKAWRGIGLSKGSMRFYPEGEAMSGQILGFVGQNENGEREGKYGVEGFYNDFLAGVTGSIKAEKDALGRRLSVGSLDLKEAENGSDVVLTIDRMIQQQSCAAIEHAVKEFEAESGSVVIMDPETGAIMGMCSYPDFDPQNVGKIDSVAVLNNPATFYLYEPGSTFKAITMAAGIESGKVTPRSTYVDTGLEVIDGLPIRDSDEKAHGVQTMLDVLVESLNLGTIYVERLLGRETFTDYVQRFGFGEKTGIELKSEVRGNISSLESKGKVFGATASFGQGISITPLQLVTAYAAIANGGKLMKPYIVQQVIGSDGTKKVTKPQVVRQVISDRTSRLMTGMLVEVVEKGHGKRAAVPGYYVAGKTGTAQVAGPNGKYLAKNITIGSFAGYAPADHPKFVMLVKVDKPKTVQFAESSAAPVFGEIASFLLSYLQVPPERPIKEKPSTPVIAPPKPVSSSSTPVSATTTR